MDLDFISSYHQSSQQQQSLLPSITSSAALSRPPTPLPSPSASSMPFAASVPLPHASDDHLQGSAASTYLNPYYHQPTATFTSPNDYYYFNSNQQQQHCQNSHQYYYASYAGYAMNNYTANGHLDPGVFGDYFGPEDTRSLYRPPAATTAMASPVKADHDAIAAHEKAKWSTRPDDADDPVRITELSTTKASNERFDFGSYNPVGHTSSTNDPSMIDGRSDGEGRSFDECSAGGKDYEYIASDSCCDSQRNDDCDPGSNYITITRTTTNGDVIQIVTRRRSANKKERRRTQSINSAFSNLRDCIPNVPADTKLSKIKTLRLATNYITYLMKLLNSPLENCMTLLAEGFRADLSNAKRSTQQNRIETQNEIQRQLRLQQYKQSIISNKKQHQNQQKSKMAAAGRNSKQSIINSRSISNNTDHGHNDQNRTIYPDQQSATTTPPIASPTLPHPPPPFQPSVPTLPSSMQLSPPSSSASSPSSSSLPPSLPLSSSMIIDRCPPPLPPPPITTDNYATTMMMYDQSKQTNNLWTFP